MNIFGKLAVSALALSVASVASAAAPISGSTDFRVTLPEVLVLYHWDDAHLILEEIATTTANDSDAREISDTSAHDLTATLGAGPYTISGDVSTTAPTGTNSVNGVVNVTLKNSWAVRSLSSAPVKLALTNPNPTLIHETVAASTIAIVADSAKLASAGTGVTNSGSANITIPSGFAPVFGDIVFDLNLANANNSGSYNTRGASNATPAPDSANGKDTFLLTLTGN